MAEKYKAGIDVGSTTVKVSILDENNRLLFGEYRRHRAHIQETLSALLKQAKAQLGEISLRFAITGSGSINLSKALHIPFVQEVVAVAAALETGYPKTDVAIELAARTRRLFTLPAGWNSG